jgi:hypothetical protein
VTEIWDPKEGQSRSFPYLPVLQWFGSSSSIPGIGVKLKGTKSFNFMGCPKGDFITFDGFLMRSGFASGAREGYNKI